MKPALLVGALLMLVGSEPLVAAPLPASGWVVWASNRQAGRHEIYLMKVGGSSDPIRLTSAGGRLPAWSPDGAWIAYLRPDQGTTWVMRPDGSEQKLLCGEGRSFWFWMPDGSGLVCGINNTYHLADPATGGSQPFFARSDYPKLGGAFWPGGISADRRWLLGTTDRINTTYPYDNGSFTTPINAAVALDRLDPSKIYFVGAGCEPSPSPFGDRLVHVAWDTPTTPDIYRLDLRDLMTRASYAPAAAMPDASWGHEYMPRLSTDGAWLTYSASTGCQHHDECDYEVFVQPLDGGSAERTRLTTDPGSDQWAHLYVGELWRADRPSLAISPTHVRSEEISTANPPAVVEARNTGGGTLGTLAVRVHYLDDEGGWLDVVSRGSGNEQSLENVLVLGGGGAAPGIHRATVDVGAVGVANLRTYSVEAELGERPPGCAFCSVGLPASGRGWLLLAALLGLVRVRRVGRGATLAPGGARRGRGCCRSRPGPRPAVDAGSRRGRAR